MHLSSSLAKSTTTTRKSAEDIKYGIAPREYLLPVGPGLRVEAKKVRIRRKPEPHRAVAETPSQAAVMLNPSYSKPRRFDDKCFQASIKVASGGPDKG